MRPHTLFMVLLSAFALTACATFRPPEISYDDDPKPAMFLGEPPRPVEVVEIPKPLPLPGQLKAVPSGKALDPEAKNPTDRVAKANEAARVQPTRNGYINAVQVYPYATGALYQVYTAPGQVTDIALQEGEQLDVGRLNFRYAIEGDTPAWRPLRAFDDGAKVFIEFPRGIRQGEMPPLFVLGPEGGAELVNYRARQNYYVVDRLFAAAELRLGGDHQQKVRIVRTDGKPRW